MTVEQQAGLARPWLTAALDCLERNMPAALVTVAGFRGSCPREVGARMLVAPQSIAGSVGGGTLEHMAIRKSRRLLQQAGPVHTLLSLALEGDLQQCCGGVVTLWIRLLGAADRNWLYSLHEAAEEFSMITELGGEAALHWIAGKLQTTTANLPAPVHAAWDEAHCGIGRVTCDQREFIWERVVRASFNIVLFGAGHVGKALVRALAPIACRLAWIDSRRQEFPAKIPDNTIINSELEGEAAVKSALPGSFFLVMTHSHALDLELCKAVLQRQDAAYLGLIGSTSKRAQFERALLRDGLSKDDLSRLTCPIGLPGIRGKSPAVIAASVLAQLLIERGRGAGFNREIPGIDPLEVERSCAAGVW